MKGKEGVTVFSSKRKAGSRWVTGGTKRGSEAHEGGCKQSRELGGGVKVIFSSSRRCKGKFKRSHVGSGGIHLHLEGKGVVRK